MDHHQQLNINRIREKISDVKGALRHLKRYAVQEETAFLTNQEAVGAARYFFIVLIEAAMNIANHFCARLLDKAPANYAEAFLLLGESDIINAQLAERLAKMARFRNLLVHGYTKVDNQRMLQIMREDLGDVDEFLDEIAVMLLGKGETDEL